jgi:hypothetical protein
VLKLNVHEMHIFLAHKIDKQNLEAQIRKSKVGNVTELRKRLQGLVLRMMQMISGKQLFMWMV